MQELCCSAFGTCTRGDVAQMQKHTHNGFNAQLARLPATGGQEAQESGTGSTRRNGCCCCCCPCTVSCRGSGYRTTPQTALRFEAAGETVPETGV